MNRKQQVLLRQLGQLYEQIHEIDSTANDIRHQYGQITADKMMWRNMGHIQTMGKTINECHIQIDMIAKGKLPELESRKNAGINLAIQYHNQWCEYEGDDWFGDMTPNAGITYQLTQLAQHINDEMVI